MIRLAGLVVACSLAVACSFASVVRAEERAGRPPPAFKASGPECGPLQRTPPFMRSVPPYTWSELRPAQQGVLIVGSSPWGVHAEAASGPQYAFVSGSSTPHFPYHWPGGPQPERQLSPGEVNRVGAGGLLPSESNPFGLVRAAHLVEVKVNGGHGGLPQREFVLSEVKHLDGTPAFPWRLSEVLDELHARYRGCMDKPQFNFSEAMKKAAERFERGEASRPPEGADKTPAQEHGQDEDSVYVTWDEPRQALAVVFATTRIRSRCWQAKEWVQPPGCPPGAPCIPGHYQTISACGSYSVRSGYEFEVDAKQGARPISFLPPTYAEAEPHFPVRSPGGERRPARR